MAGHHGPRHHDGCRRRDGRGGTIVDVAVADGSFTTLVAAVQAAGLVETLSGDGPFTVFAPTDEAFAAALDALGLTADELLADTETVDCSPHLPRDRRRSPGCHRGHARRTERHHGQRCRRDDQVDGDKVMVNDANVIAVDVLASNGIIHVIDTVLLPPAG